MPEALNPALVQSLTAGKLTELADELYWYHTIRLPGGIVTKGDYDMDQYVDAFSFPKAMQGLKVLDVGRASGYFSFLFEDRGAAVVATELSSYMDWDFVGGEEERTRRIAEIDDIDDFTRIHISGAFSLAHAAKRSKVVPMEASVYQISNETTGGPFDIVFAGSITSHLRDPILALEKLRGVTKPDGLCIISAPYIDLDESLPLAAMVGTADLDRRSWWVVNKKCITEMLHSAGFDDVVIVGHFYLSMNRKIGAPSVFPHITVHARP